MVLKSIAQYNGMRYRKRKISTRLWDYCRWTLPVAPGDLSLCRETGCWSPGVRLYRQDRGGAEWRRVSSW